MPLPFDRTPLITAVHAAINSRGFEVVGVHRHGAWGLRVSMRDPVDARYHEVTVGPIMQGSDDRDAVDDAIYDAFIEKLHHMEAPKETIKRIRVDWMVETNKRNLSDSVITKNPDILEDLLESVHMRIRNHIPYDDGELPPLPINEAARRVRSLHARYQDALRLRLPTSASYLARKLGHLHEHHEDLTGAKMPWSAGWVAEQCLAALDELMSEGGHILLAITSDQALALRNVILPRLVDIEQHGYTEEYEGEAKDLRSIGNVLEAAINRDASKKQGEVP